MEKINFKSLFKTEKGLILIIILLFFIKGVFYFGYFKLPLSDFLAFKSMALSLTGFKLPQDLTRAPLYPIIIGIISFLIPGKQAILYAGELINLILGTLSVFMMFLISKRLNLKYPLIASGLFAVFPVITFVTSQPLVEIPLITGMLLVIYFDLKESNLSYLFASLTALIRWDGVLLLFLLVLKNMIYCKSRKRTLLFGIISVVPIAIWFILPYLKGIQMTRYLGMFEAFLTGKVSLVHLGNYGNVFKNLLLCSGKLTSKTNFIEIFFIIIIVTLLLCGLVRLMKKSFKNIFVLLVFLISYMYFLLIISAPGQLEERNVGIIIFVLIIFFTEGLGQVISLIYEKLGNRKIVKIIFSSVLIFIFCRGFYGMTVIMNNPAFHWGELVSLARWYERFANPGDKLLMSNPDLIKDITSLDKDYFINPSDLNVNKTDRLRSLLERIKNKGVTYVVYIHRYSNERWVTFPLNEYFHLDRFKLGGLYFFRVKTIQIGDSCQYALIFKVVKDSRNLFSGNYFFFINNEKTGLKTDKVFEVIDKKNLVRQTVEVQNYSFENVGERNLPADWDISSWGKKQKLLVDSEKSYDGKYSFMLFVDRKEVNYSLNSKTFELKPGMVNLEVAVMTELKGKYDGFLQLLIFDKNMKNVHIYHLNISNINTRSQWQDVKMSDSLPLNVKYGQIILRITGSDLGNTIRIDDFRLTNWQIKLDEML